MKKSEMLMWLERHYGIRHVMLEFGYITRKDFCEEVLSLMEQKGMLPPFVDKKTGEYYEDGNWIDLHVENAVYAGQCKWEPENKEKT